MGRLLGTRTIRDPLVISIERNASLQCPSTGIFSICFSTKRQRNAARPERTPCSVLEAVTEEMGKEARHEDECYIPCDALDLEKHVLGESRHFDGGTGWLVIAKELGVDVVDGAKVVHVLQEHLFAQYGWSTLMNRCVGHARSF